MKLQQIAITAAVLLLFATIGTLLVALTYEGTRAQIAANEREALLRKLNVLVPQERYDNAIFEDTLQVTGAPLLGSMEPVTVYRVVLDEKAATLVTPIIRKSNKPTFRHWGIAMAVAGVLVAAAGGALWWQPWKAGRTGPATLPWSRTIGSG
jgi:Na+-translocating ferredoxin:NAD+ oxidoreductase RnfG subunit